MPDDVREPFRPVLQREPVRVPDKGFTTGNTSGLTASELVALDRLMASGLGEHAAKLALDAAVREWLRPRDAAEADLERLLAWR